jgi:hypothetical protein
MFCLSRMFFHWRFFVCPDCFWFIYTECCLTGVVMSFRTAVCVYFLSESLFLWRLFFTGVVSLIQIVVSLALLCLSRLLFHWCCFVYTDCCFTGFVMSITTVVSLVLFRLYRLLFHWLCYVYHDCCFTCVVSFVDIIVILTVNLNDNLLMMGASVEYVGSWKQKF